MIKYSHQIVNGANYYYTLNVQDAVNLAMEFKSKGLYNLFRGHGSDKYLFMSTLARKGKTFAESKEYSKTVGLLGTILEKNKVTKWIFDNTDPNTYPDTFYAIAQHYGVPTNFLDLTKSPKVAAFFCIHNRPETIKNDFGKIYCIHRDEFIKNVAVLTEIFPMDSMRVEIIDIDVSNLWRLQAQEGLFLHLPIFITPDLREHNFEDFFFAIDSIVFPITGNEDICSQDMIYPKRKSQLEMVLDQYFDNKLRKDFIESIKTVPLMTWDIPDDPNRIFEGNPTIDPSWVFEGFEQWHKIVDEQWTSLEKISMNLLLDMRLELKEFKNDISIQLINNMTNINDPKSKLITFNINLINYYPTWEIDQENAKNLIGLAIGRIWDGMRLYPYTLDDIFCSISNFLSIINAEYTFDKFPATRKSYKFWNEIFETPFEIDVGSDDTSYCKAVVNLSTFKKLFRKGFDRLLKKEYTADYRNEIFFEIFSIIRTPKYLFDFYSLKSAFIEEIIPSQVYLRGQKIKSPIFFSPGQIQILGPH